MEYEHTRILTLESKVELNLEPKCFENLAGVPF